MSKSIRLREYVGLILILLLAAALRLFDITDEPLWLDEGYSWWDAQQSFSALWHLVPQCDPHPPFYALMLKGWIGLFGDHILALRSLSTVFGVFATLFVFLAGRQIDRRIGWIAGLLFALTPFQIEFGQEARPYTLVALGAAILLYGLIRVFHNSDRSSRGGWVALVVGGVISLWSNNTAPFTIAAASIVVLALLWIDVDTRALKWRLLVVAAIVALMWLPYLPVYLQQAEGVSSDFWIPRPDIWRVFNELRFVEGLGSFKVLIFLFPLWMLSLYCLWRDGNKRAAWILFGLFVLPAALNLAVSLIIKPIFLARALIGIAPAFSVALAAAFASLKRPPLRYAALAVYGACSIFVASQTLYLKDHRKEPWDEIAATLVQYAQGNAAVVITVPNEMVLPLQHALFEAGQSLEIQEVPTNFPAPGLTARYPSGKCAPSIAGQDLSAIRRLVAGKKTVLFLTRQNNAYDPKDEIRPILENNGFKEVEALSFMPGYIEVHTFEATVNPQTK